MVTRGAEAMTQNLPEKLLQQRMRLQLFSLESPTELPGTTRNFSEIGVSPMTELANNLCDTSLGATPVQDSKRRLSMDSESSGSTPSPPERSNSGTADTPLSSIINIPKRILLHTTNSSSKAAAAAFFPDDLDPENKENFPYFTFLSPGKRRTSSCSSSSSQRSVASNSSSSSCSSPRAHQLGKLGVSPAKCLLPRSRPLPPPPLVGLLSPFSLTLSQAAKRPKPIPLVFSIFNDGEKPDNEPPGCDKGKDDGQTALASTESDVAVADILLTGCPGEPAPAERCCRVEPGSMEDILTDCSPGKEDDGVAPLRPSPQRDQQKPAAAAVASRIITDDGFGLDTLATIREDSESEGSPRFDLSALLSKRIILPSHLETAALYQQPCETLAFRRDPTTVACRSGAEGGGALYKPPPPRRPNNGGGFKRPLFRRALSMLDPPTGSCLDTSSPVSRGGGGSYDFNIPRFKRPNPPRDGSSQPSLSKRFKSSPNSLLTERCNSLEESAAESGQARPKFHRSHSENELSIMKSCQLKEEVENILPDSSRLYALPSTHDSKHPSLRSIARDTLAKLIKGEYDHVINSYRIIDARYKFEFEGGHIRGAENWQHGEDEEFLSAFLPSHPLPAPPPPFQPNDTTKRNILIFHCEFSSQRGPDFYRKLRERDRQLNQHVYPALYHPEVYLLHLGYKEFFQYYPDLCTGRYTAMVDPNHEHDLRKMRAKSKSWSGGTVTRTGRMGRLNL